MKHECCVCSNKLFALSKRLKISDGELCENCAAKVSKFLYEPKKMSRGEIISHLESRKENLGKIKDVFEPDLMYYGFNVRILADCKNRLWCYFTSRSYGEEEFFSESCKNRIAEKNPDIFSFDDIESVGSYSVEDEIRVVVSIKNNQWIRKVVIKDTIPGGQQRISNVVKAIADGSIADEKGSVCRNNKRVIEIDC